MKLSIIIVNYNVTDFLDRCLASIERYISEVDYEVIVIDNQSSDISWKSLISKYPSVLFIPNEKNEGFSKANNKAIKQAKGEYLLLLNPDTELEQDGMKDVLDFVDRHSDFGCLGVRMHDAEGEFLPESKRSVPDMFNSFEKLFVNLRSKNEKSYYRDDVGEYDTAEVEVITGAFFLVRRDVYNEIGGLDESYFMYGEDIDICYTLIRKGCRNFYYGAYSILHHKGESTVKDEKYLNRFYGAMQIFLNKYYRKKPLQYHILSLGLKLKHRLEKNKLS